MIPAGSVQLAAQFATLVLGSLAWLLVCLPGKAQEAVRESPNEAFSQEQFDFFESRIRPVLSEHCFECHSGESKSIQAKLRLDGRAWAIQGGESGAAIVPGKPQDSPLVAAVSWKGLEMPPDRRLSAEQIADFTKWVEMGAPWPGDSDIDPSLPKNAQYDWHKWRTEHWAFQPITAPTPPDAGESTWCKSPIDRFVLQGHLSNGLIPNSSTDPRTLYRRICFDLCGLPPTPEEVTAFEAAYSSDPNRAVSEHVDRLLASKEYAQRWARHWLDVARYSDGFGGFLDNAQYEHAWRYRDWVVDALDSDLPFADFLRLQIAGDLLGDQNSSIATGFLALGPNYISDGGDPDSTAQARSETLSDRIDTLSQGMLGLTVACARCHDHKFDPVPQEDYYSFAGIFNNSATREIALVSSDVVDTYNKHQGLIQVQSKLLEGIRKTHQEEKDSEKQKSLQEQIDAEQIKFEELKKSSPPVYPKAHSMHDVGSADMAVAIRGNLLKPGTMAKRRFLRIIAGDDRAAFTNGSGRLELANAIADPSNPLPARVFVNRVWMHHFGQALVRTPNNFGALGEKPTHPKLLDWLANRLIQTGSIKDLHRTIINSATYQLSSQPNEQNFSKDADNRWIWRMNPRRMDAEMWRDSLLLVCGELDSCVGGPPTDKIDSLRRTLYFKVSRNGDVFSTDEFLRLFDFPLMRSSVAQRPSSNVPQQYLFLLNSPFMQQRAKSLSQRLVKEATGHSARIHRAYQLLYQRPPNDKELAIGLEYLSKVAQDSAQQESQWEQYCQALLGSNELMYLP